MNLMSYPGLRQLPHATIKAFYTWLIGGVYGTKEKFTANRTYYVRTDGSDSNVGLIDSAVGAFFTIQKAFDVIKTIDLGGFTATISIGIGTFAGVNLNGSVTGGNLNITGSAVSTTTISESTLNACILMSSPQSALITLSAFKVTSTGTTNGIRMDAAGKIICTVDFGSCGGAHVVCVAPGAFLHRLGNYTISGGATAHISVGFLGFVRADGNTVTLTGTPAFSTGFVSASNGGALLGGGVTFSGSATGVRYVLGSGGIMNTAGGGANYFPGSSPGTNTDTTGVYV